MNPHALHVLQYGQVLDVVAGFAGSALGAAAVRALTPRGDRTWIEEELSRVAAVRALTSSDDGWSSAPIPDVARSLARLRVEGTALSGSELLGIAQLLRSARTTAEGLASPRQPLIARGVLAGIREKLISDAGAEQVIDASIDDDGSVKDAASPTLRRTRRELRSARGDLVGLLERVMARLEPHQRVMDASVTMRNGRYVIPVRREARGTVGGIVQDASGSGATLFVEPPAAIEASNRIRELEGDEEREVERILASLTERVRPLQPGLSSSLEALVELDSLYARARYAVTYECSGTQLVDAGSGFHIIVGRHPLLLAQAAAGAGKVVPFSLFMESDERTLLISGPNTGGKTVLLKALALMSVMVQAGIPAPCAEESRIALYDDVFADIGDEQSIEASLSTFSAHVRNLGEILRSATAQSLVVADELGSGTDPLEGAALGGAILEALTARGVTTVATTHLGALKELAGEVRGVINASLEFDAVELAPTYRLIKGIPGRSYGLSIARRLQLPVDVLDRAEARIPTVERDVSVLLASLEQRDRDMELRDVELAALRRDAEAKAAALVDREQRLRERERAVEREARKEARRYLLEARKTVESTIQQLKTADSAARDAAGTAARRHVEQLAVKTAERLDQLDREETNARRRTAVPLPAPAVLQVGDRVEVLSLNGRQGSVIELRDDGVVVALGAFKLTYPASDLRRIDPARLQAEKVPLMGDVPEVSAAGEIDLRGMRVDEIDDVLLRSVDDAIRAERRELRVIHGKGTGALRDRVSEMLQKDTRIRGFRLGLWNEGGAGVTVIEL